MTIEKTFQGAWRITGWATDDYGYEYLVTRQYMGYTKKQAIALFKAEITNN